MSRARPVEDLLADPADAAGAARAPAARARDPRLRGEGAQAAGQRRATAATPTSAGPTRSGTWWRRPSFRSSRCSPAFRWPAASATGASSRRRTPNATPRACARRATTCTSTAWRRTRRSGASTTRCCRPSSAIPDAELARLMFHELAHQVAYVKDDSHLQRVVRGGGRARRRAALARGDRPRRGAEGAPCRAGKEQGVHRRDRAGARAAARCCTASASRPRRCASASARSWTA